MRLSAKLFCVAGVLIFCVVAPSKDANTLIAHLQAAKRSAMSAQVRATIRYTVTSPDGVRKSTFDWAYYDGLEHEKTLPGSKIMAGAEAVWNGREGMYRMPNPTTGAPAKHGIIKIVRDHSPAWISPIRAGYIATVGTRAPRGLWIVDALQEPGVTVETTPEGHIRVNAPRDAIGGRRSIELDPRQGYIVVLDTVYGEGNQTGAKGAKTLVLEREVRVLEAKKFGNCWIPTKTEEREIRAVGPASKSITEVIDLTAKIPKPTFASIGQVGDSVRDGGLEHTLRTVPNTHPTLSATPPIFGPGSNDQSGAVTPGSRERPRFVTFLAVAIGLAIGVSVLLLFRRGRRRPDDYWGPPGQGPTGPKR